MPPMNKCQIVKWVARALLLFLSFCGIATIITNTTAHLNLESRTMVVAWTLGIGGIIAFILSLPLKRR